jgi:hypothetical protein
MMHAQFVVEQRMSSSGVQALAARNLELLRVIEDTVDCLVADSNLLRSICEAYREIQSKLTFNDAEIDPSGRTRAALEKASDSCVRIHNDAKARHLSAIRDPLLRSDDGVVDAYSEFMTVVNELHDTIEELSEWIAVHDAVLQPTTGSTFDSVDSLFESLLAKK